MHQESAQKPAFEVLVGDHRYAVYADGRIEGFGKDAVIINRMPRIIAAEAKAKEAV